MALLGGKMTQEQYYKELGEKINKDSSADVDFLSMLRLIYLYDKKMNNNSKEKEFDIILNDARIAFYKENEEKKKDCFAKVLSICSEKIKDGFLNAKDDKEGLFNVHNLVVANEISDKKETIKEARYIETREFETNRFKDEYITTKENADAANKYCYVQSYLNLIVAGKGEVNRDKLIETLKVVAEERNSKLKQVENTYFDRVINDVVATDCRVQNKANDTRTANI